MSVNALPACRSQSLGAAATRAVVLLALAASTAGAQNAQAYAAQLSAFFTTIRAGNTNVSGAGVEVQQRFNRIYATEGFGAVSLGIGGQYTVHTKVRDRLQIAGVFVEPRWVPATGSSSVFPYLSARLAVQRMKGTFQFAEGGSSLGSAFGAGGGIAFKLSRSVNIDAGAQLVRQQFGAIGDVEFRPFTTYTAKVGISLGYPR
ncbi:MAG: hypothetical protein V4813_05830 [Gemmatimonadota bacterium]